MILWNVIIVCSFLIIVLIIFFFSLYKKENINYYIAGSGLSWPYIGISIIAANISTEHFIGMSGSGYENGMAIASHEWTAAIALIIISLYILPKFMSAGIKTLPEYLEYRFNHWVRLTVAILMLIFIIFIQFASIIYGGALAMKIIFDVDLFLGMFVLSLLSLLFTSWARLSTIAQTNVVFVATFILGGSWITLKGIHYIGGIEKFVAYSDDKLKSLLPIDNDFMPWTSALLGGLWVAQFFYFGFNQFITQYLLSGKSLSDAQKGILLAASLKLFVPFIVIIPGIIAFEITQIKPHDNDLVYPMLIDFLAKFHFEIKGIVFCILLSAAISSLNSMSIAAANIFINDIYIRFFRNITEKDKSTVKKYVIVIIVFISSIWAPFIAKFHDSFEYMQKFAGMISPGITAVYILGLYNRKTTSLSALLILGINPILYLGTINFYPSISFYNVMGINFLILIVISWLLSILFPEKNPKTVHEKYEIKFERNLLVVIWSIFLTTMIFFLYTLFE